MLLVILACCLGRLSADEYVLVAYYVRVTGIVEDLGSCLLSGLAGLEPQLFPTQVWMHAKSICFADSVVELMSELCLVTRTRLGIPKDPNLS
jgi:hypothetical protein